jgi:putative hemolysin
MNLVTVIITAVFCIYCSAFCSGTETGLMSASRIRIYLREQKERSKSTTRLKKMLLKIEDPILTCLIGTNLFNVIATSIVTAYLTTLYGSKGDFIAASVMAVSIIVFGEIIPKVIYLEFPESMTIKSIPALRILMILVSPIRWLMMQYSHMLNLLIPGDDSDDSDDISREKMSHILASFQPEDRDKQFKVVANKCLALSNTTIESLTKQIDNAVCLHDGMSIEQCCKIAAISGYSRLPVLNNTKRLTGWVLSRDLLFLNNRPEDQLPSKAVRKAILVQGIMSPWDLFEELRWHKQQIAFVVDTKGDPTGLVTLEDLLEVVIGSIEDEFDVQQVAI